MSNYNSLKTTIDANIKQNGNQEITGQILNSVLNQMVTTLGAGYQFAGVATTATNPGSPDAKVFYIANGKGTYTNFGGVSVMEDDVVVLYWDSSWHKVSTGIASQRKLTELKERVDALALGAFYGYFPDSSSLPIDVTTPGYAYVGLDNPYKIWNFNGKSWSDSGTSIDMNDADEEDITRNADGKLQFKDRSYGDGMGYVILRKDKTFAEQVIKDNTIYEIRYDFTLDEDVTIPANCVLKFDGGSISASGNNNTITGQNTEIINGSFNNIIFSGTFNKEQGIINIHEFGCKTTVEDANFDNSDIFQNLINVSYDSNVALFVPSGKFLINKTITLKAASVVKGVQRHTHGNSSILATSIQTADFKMFADGIRHATFDSIGIYRDRTNEEAIARTEVWSGQTASLGYGLAGTAFGSSTELRTIGCNLVGWGNCFDTPAILFCDNTDFGYCENIVIAKQNTASTANIDHANIWCCGQTFRGGSYGFTNCSLTNSWIEYYDAVFKGDNRFPIMGINIINTTFTTTDTWTDPNAHLIEYGAGSSWNRVYINFDKCYIKAFGKLLKNLDGTTYIVEMNDCNVQHFSEEDEDLYINGNSNFYVGTTANLSTHIKRRGINTNTGLVNIPLSLNYTPESESEAGTYALYKYARNGNPIVYKDVNSNMMVLPPMYFRVNNEGVSNPQLPQFFEYFSNLSQLPKGVILRFRNPTRGITEDIVDLKPKSGTFANKPTTTDYNLKVGDSYFCTDKQTTEGATNGIMIYHKGNDVWVDALGRIIS